MRPWIVFCKLFPRIEKLFLIYTLLQVLCFYFIFTVFVTVGFGDITAVNTSERVLLLLLLLLLPSPALLPLPLRPQKHYSSHSYNCYCTMISSDAFAF
jgi:hypothetical protein